MIYMKHYWIKAYELWRWNIMNYDIFYDIEYMNPISNELLQFTKVVCVCVCVCLFACVFGKGSREEQGRVIRNPSEFLPSSENGHIR